MWRWITGVYGPYGRVRRRGHGGNPFPFCKRFPWLPRGWRRIYPFGITPYSPEMELQFLKEREKLIQEEIEWIKKRINEIEEGKE